METALASNEPTSITVTRRGAITYLTPRASLLESSGLEILQQSIEDCLNQSRFQLILDLKMINLVNSEVLSSLLDFQDQLIRLGGWLKIHNVNNTIKDIFQITGFTQHISLSTVEEVNNEPEQIRDKENLRIGDHLVMQGLLSQEQLEQAIKIQHESHKRIGDIIVEKKWASTSAVYGALAKQLKIPFVNLRNGLYDPDVVAKLDKSIAERLRILPLFLVRDVLYVATEKPQNLISHKEIESRLDVLVAPVLVSPGDLDKNITEAYGSRHFSEELVVDLDEDFEVYDEKDNQDYDAIDVMADGSPVINMVNSIIQRAVVDGASDIHIEPSRNNSMVRFRVDGILYEIMKPAKELHPAIVSRLKVMANLDIAERRMPQDGRIQVHTQGRQVDLRFSSLPGLYGEKIVLRVLDKNGAILNLEKLGMESSSLFQFKKLLGRSNGLVLVTGPTGSGKTSSLYAALNYLNSTEKNIVTIEDPVEYQLDIINQNEVKPQIGLSYAKMLKHILRQDPDIVMIGEIREKETAEIAVQAALTGHLVLSTLHTNNSIGAITRLIDMGIEPFMLSSALLGVVAQRLIRTICPSCKTKFIAPPEVAEQYGWDTSKPLHLTRGRGCESCYDSGYKGRAGIHEILETDGELQRLVMTNPSRDQLQQYLEEHKVKSLRDHGLDRVLAGETTLDEISRVANN